MTIRKEQSADLIFTNGNILSMNDRMPKPKTVVVKNGLIADVGDESLISCWKGRETEIVDLQGKTLMPGFIESHVHPTLHSLNLLQLDCRSTRTPSIDHILQNLTVKAKSVPADKWIIGYGWNEATLEERRIPTRFELDRAAPDHPVVLHRICNHMLVANSKALELAGITKDTPDPPGGHIEKDSVTGAPTGLIQESAMALFSIPPHDMKDLTKSFKLAQQDFAKWGITTVHDMVTTPRDFSMYQQLSLQNELTVRVRPWLIAVPIAGPSGLFDDVIGLGLQSGFGHDMVKIQGMKFFLDGAGSGGTAAVFEPNVSDGRSGILYYDESVFGSYVQKCAEAGLRVAVHAIGDRAIETAIRGFEMAQEVNDITQLRNRIEHVALPTNDHLMRMKKLNLIAASSIGFIYHLGDSYLYHYGSERMKRLYPHKSFKEYGIIAPGNSDFPVVNGNPFEGIYGAVTRTTKKGTVLDEVQNISVMDALKAFTVDAAYSSYEEQLLGVIQTNAKADLIVVSDDPLSVEPSQLKQIEVLHTFVNGSLVYSK